MKGLVLMTRKLKTLGISLVAVFAMSAIAASAASAIEFHSEGENTVLTGKQAASHTLSVPAGTLKCTTATITATVAGKTVKSITAIPTYEGCTLAGAAATIHMNGCDYTLLQPATLTTGTVTLDCPTGKAIEVTAPTCTITIAAQGPLSKIEYVNTGSGTTREVDVNAEVKNIKGTQHGTKCLGNGGESTKDFTNGEFKGSTLITGEHTVEGVTTHTGIWVE